MAINPVQALRTFGRNVWKLATSPVIISGTPAYKKLIIGAGANKIAIKARNDLELDLINHKDKSAARLQLNGHTLYIPEGKIVSVSSSDNADLQVPIRDVHFMIHSQNGTIKLENASSPDSNRVIGITDTETREFTPLLADQSMILAHNSIVGVKLAGGGTFQMLIKVEADAIDQLRSEQARLLLKQDEPAQPAALTAAEQASLEAAIFELRLLDGTVFDGTESVANMVEIDRANMGRLDRRAVRVNSFYSAVSLIGAPISFILGSSVLGFGFEDGLSAHPFLDLAFLISLLGTTSAYRAAKQALEGRYGQSAHYEVAYVPDSRAAKKLDKEIAQVLGRLPDQTVAAFLRHLSAGRRRHLLNLLRQEIDQTRLDQIVLGIDQLQRTKKQAEPVIATESPATAEPESRARLEIAARARRELA